ncbi:hypothetical protein B0J15DRAFT_447743 [Fusarium solani]|uniref:NACHT domain-containing protein n=1 Tax=Fusarium solani TaxID=169388 RepID=A0A9P9KDG6_FUSSL|nr:uncharacterized protein B0J15DRAFT_447743 [Fusarium solani]KAH7253331.1 hypothetical protein B0J15DRAFT_447743 [Fusarium solani]
MSTDNPVEQSFEEAQLRFQRDLRGDPKLYENILTARTIDEVYKATSDIQAKMAPQGKMRHLAKIKPLLDRLAEYALVIEVFMQVKPDVIALIWGPIKVILLWSSQISNVLDKIADTLESVGHALPQFAVLAQTFDSNDVVKDALALFYLDIMDFYRIIFDFFRKTRWKKFFDVIWPGHQQKLDVVISNFQKHSNLLRNEVTVRDIKEAREARLRSSEHFSKTEAFQELQKYLGLKSRVSPSMYDNRLDWLRNRRTSGCATWLFQDEKFCEWLDASKSTLVWLWLQGIPGAGKTYLTAAAIEHTKEQHRALFAFATHANHNSVSAFSILQSLMFQAAEDDKDFQTVLVESQERELGGNTGYVVGLLKTFLGTSGTTYIIIDGLDEMEECERQILLHRLTEISNECKDLRLLISSRSEDDISRRLEEKATTIRVDDRNSGSIQIYVDRRCQDWMASRYFNPATKKELLQFISPLSAKANGNIEEIRSELKALPNDLEGAYHRIFRRINKLRPQLRAKCRKILGWIGSAPVPLTALEMEQALSIDPNPEEELSEPPQLVTNVSFVQMCGPIIEVVDEKLQFVHFTVHEYIFSSDIRNHIDIDSSAHELALTFLAYLGSSIMDVDLDDEDIQENILAGKYRLFHYATFFWCTLIYRTNGQDRRSSQRRELLDQLIQRGRNYRFKTAAEHSKPLFNNSYLQKKSPEAFAMVCEALQFHLDDKRFDWNWSNSESWVDLDPLTTSQMLVRIQEQHEALALNPTRVTSLQSHYGARLFRCRFAFCEHSYRGFQTSRDREDHIKTHGRPWKCTIPNCDFSTIGFSSKATRDNHWLKLHLPNLDQLQTGPNEFDSLDVVEAQPILFFLVAKGDADGVRRLLSAPGGKQLKAEVIDSARCLAAKEGSLALTQLLAPGGETGVPHAIVTSAIQSEDVDFARWAISMAQPLDRVKIMKVALGSKSEEIYTLWEDHLLNVLKGVPGISKHDEKGVVEIYFNRTLFTGIKNDPLKEARVKHTLRKLADRMTPALLGSLLVGIAKSSCSLSLAEELLALGALIDYPQPSRGTGMTALQIAAKKTTKEAALLMQCLILNGADPDPMTWTHTRTGRAKGALGIAQYVGRTWDELVEAGDEARSKLEQRMDEVLP